MTNPDICRMCDRDHNSCCKLRGENRDEIPTPISDAEIDRIFDHLDEDLDHGIFDRIKNTPEFIGHMNALFPELPESIDMVFPPKGRHWELKTETNACVFLDVNGCTLPDEARPLFCRIYPFWFFGDHPQIFQDHHCLALQKCKTIPELFLALGTNPEKLRQLHAQICSDWGLVRSTPLKRIEVLR